MVTRLTFSGSVSATADSDGMNWKTSESITLPLTSATATDKITHYPKWSKIFFNAMYQTLINAGYEPVINENEYSISLWGFKFYTVVSAYTSNIYYIRPYIYISGTTSNFSTNHEIVTAYSSATKADYNFTLTLRGSDNVCVVTFSTDNSTSEYGVLFLAKATHIPTKSDYFVFNHAITNQPYFINKSDLYDMYTNSSCLFMSIKSSYNYNKHNEYYGIGKGYNKVLLATEQYDFVIKDMLYTPNDAIINMGNYYKIGNELYYSNNAYYSSTYSSDYRYLYKVDTVVDS